MTQINKQDVTFCGQCNVPLHNDCKNSCLDCGEVLCDTCYSTNNFKCEKCHIPNQEFQTIRRSHLELYQSCPYALYLQLVKGVVPPTNDYAELGILIHQLIDMMSNRLLTLEEAHIELAKQMEEKFKGNEKYDLFFNTGLSSLYKFAELQDLFGDTFETEKNIIFDVEAGLPSVSCTLDRIDFVGDHIHISDWKTGKPMSGQKLVNDLQPPLYIEAVRKEYGKYPTTFTLYYLAADKIKKYEHIGNGIYEVKSGKTTYTLNVSDALKRTKEILTKINNKQFTLPKDVSLWYCQNMCHHYTSGVCASATKEAWKVLKEKYEG